MNNTTIDYYNKNTEEFISGTINADVSNLYEMFLKHIPTNGHILDLGCGSGRDSKAFIDMGYMVTAIDGSAELCKSASEFIGQEVICKTFDKLDANDEFDGFWACASLLHIPKNELADIFNKISAALKDGGYLYCSFKYGDFEGDRSGRYFTDLTESSLDEVIKSVPNLTIIDTSVTKDVRDGRDGESWLNAIIKSEQGKNYISKLTMNNDTTIEINSNDIVVFVGANNVGKSQALKDIYSIASKNAQKTILKDIEIVKSNIDIHTFIEKTSTIINNGTSKTFLGLNYNVSELTLKNFDRNKYWGSFAPVFICHLQTEKRLEIVNPPASVRKDTNYTHPIHYVAFNPKHREWLSNSFKKAFGESLMPHMQFGSVIPLCIGEPIQLDKAFTDEFSRQDEVYKILDAYKQLQDQGDGIRSFTGILLYLMIEHYSTFLIDEPESFLHPPQARIMGQIVGESLRQNQQSFISTHSEDVIKGLLDTCPERLKIIRITREDNTNSFSILNTSEIQSIWKDSLLQHSNILSSLFYKSVVICESDSDCKMYAMINDYLKQSDGHYSETLFVHCGGKHRMAKIAKTLKSLDIDVKVIADIDILNDGKIFQNLLESIDLDWSILKPHYNNIVSNLHSSKEVISRSSAKVLINEILDRSSKSELSNKELSEISEIIQKESKWKQLKKSGVSALPSGDATSSYTKISSVLENTGVFIVPVGELECFIKEVGGHGPEWVNQVIEKYPDFTDPVYGEIKKFVTKLNL